MMNNCNQRNRLEGSAQLNGPGMLFLVLAHQKTSIETVEPLFWYCNHTLTFCHHFDGVWEIWDISDVSKHLFSNDHAMLFLLKTQFWNRFGCNSFYIKNIIKNCFELYEVLISSATCLMLLNTNDSAISKHSL